MSPTRRDFLCGGLALAALPAKAHLAFADATATRNTRWLQALPICNGRIGGMVLGSLHQRARIALTESTGRSGAPSSSSRTWRSIRSAVGSSPGRLTRRKMPFAHQPEDTATESMGPTCNLVLAYARFRVCLEAQAFSSKLKLARQNLPPLPFHQQTGTKPPPTPPTTPHGDKQPQKDRRNPAANPYETR